MKERDKTERKMRYQLHDKGSNYKYLITLSIEVKAINTTYTTVKQTDAERK